MRHLAKQLAVIAFLAAGSAALADVPKASDVPPLISKLTSGNAKARAEAAREIGEIGLVKSSYARPAIPALIKAAQKDKDNTVREAALIALGEVDPEPEIALPIFLAALKDKSDEVKAAAAQGASHLAGDAQDALPELRNIREELNKMQIEKLEQKERDKKRNLMRAVNEAMQAIQSGPKRKK
jgi:HEAT repeat protein